MEQKDPLAPLMGQGMYLDDFLVRKVVGGYVLIVEWSEPADPNAPQAAVLQLAQVMSQRHECPRRKQQVQIVARTTDEVLRLLTRWMTGRSPVPDTMEGEL